MPIFIVAEEEAHVPQAPCAVQLSVAVLQACRLCYASAGKVGIESGMAKLLA